MGRCGALVESQPFDRRVVGSNSALAATEDLGQVLNSQLSVVLRRETLVVTMIRMMKIIENND